MAKNQGKALCDPAIRAKAKEAYKRNHSLRVIDSLTTLDLTPIDEQIHDLEEKLARLKNARKIVLQLRGESAPGALLNGTDSLDNPLGTSQSIGQKLPPVKSVADADAWDADKVRKKIHELLEDEGSPLELVALAKWTHIPGAIIQKFLATDPQIVYGNKGYRLKEE